MKKIWGFVVGLCVCIGAVSVISLERDQASTVMETEKSSIVESPEAAESDSETLVTLKAALNPDYIGVQEGWFGDLLQEKFGMKVELPMAQGSFEDRESGTDLYAFFGETTYYDAVKNGELKNLEKDIKNSPDIWNKYKKALQRMKKVTKEKTGKTGIYGVPIWLKSFEDQGKDCYCISIPEDAANPRLAMDLLTWSASEEGIMNIAFGPEGQMWKKSGKTYTLIEDWYQKDEESSGGAFVETKDGKESLDTARSKMTLVGNESLGRKLLRND